MNPENPQQRAWCYFRNLVHTVYREARHVGPPEDTEAKLHVTGPVFALAARRCSKNRALRQQALGNSFIVLLMPFSKAGQDGPRKPSIASAICRAELRA